MDTKDAIIDRRAERQMVKEVHEVAPDIRCSILSHAFSIKTVNFCDDTRFMASTDQMNSGWITKQQAGQQGYGFDAEVAQVDIAT